MALHRCRCGWVGTDPTPEKDQDGDFEANACPDCDLLVETVHVKGAVAIFERIAAVDRVLVDLGRGILRTSAGTAPIQGSLREACRLAAQAERQALRWTLDLVTSPSVAVAGEDLLNSNERRQ